MGIVHTVIYRHRLSLMLLSGALALLIVLLLSFTAHTQTAAAQISPLTQSPVATAQPESQQPQVILTNTPSPLSLPQAENSQPLPSAQEQETTADRDLNENPQPLIPLGEPSQAQPSLILVGLLLVGFGLLVVVLLVARRRE